MTDTMLGRISAISFGYGGYQGAQFGVSVTLKLAGGLGCADFRGAFPPDPKFDNPQVELSKREAIADTAIWLAGILDAAKKRTVAELPGTPIEATFDGMALKSWRVLTEVL